MKRRYYTKVTRKGQVTVPVEVRREMNISVGDQIGFVVEEGEVKIERTGNWAEATYGIFKRPGQRTLTERELKDLAEKAWADEAIERDERVKRGRTSRE